MVIVSLLGVVLALAVLIVGALKGKKIFPLCIIGCIIVALTNGTNVWEMFSTTFMSGLQSTLVAFFITITCGTVYSQMMNYTGSTNAIAYWCIKVFGKNNAVLVLMVITGLLGLAGLNGTMMVFAVYGLFTIIMKEANLPRELAPGFIFFGCGLWAEGYFPASVHLNNILPTQFLGTSLLAAPVLGLGTGLITIIFSVWYFKHTSKKLAGQGIGWTDPQQNVYVYDGPSFTEETAPSALKAFLPMILMIGLVVVLSLVGVPSGLVAAVALLAAGLLAGLLNLDTLKANGVELFGFLQSCYDQSWKSCGFIAGLMAFGSVIAASAGFQTILQWIIGLDISVYIKGALCSGALAAAAGSSSTGIRLTGQYLGEYFLNSGANLDLLHRFISIGGTIGTEVPHCNAVYLIIGMFGVEYKKGYKHIGVQFWVGGLLALIIGLVVVIALGM